MPIPTGSLHADTVRTYKTCHYRMALLVSGCDMYEIHDNAYGCDESYQFFFLFIFSINEIHYLLAVEMFYREKKIAWLIYYMLLVFENGSNKLCALVLISFHRVQLNCSI